MFLNFLIPFYDTWDISDLLEQTNRMAQTTQGHIHLLSVIPAVDLTASVPNLVGGMTTPLVYPHSSYARRRKKEATEALSHLVQACRTADVSCTSELCIGYMEYLTSERASLADLIVSRKTAPTSWLRRPWATSWPFIVRRSRCPALLFSSCTGKGEQIIVLHRWDRKDSSAVRTAARVACLLRVKLLILAYCKRQMKSALPEEFLRESLAPFDFVVRPEIKVLESEKAVLLELRDRPLSVLTVPARWSSLGWSLGRHLRKIGLDGSIPVLISP